MRSQAVGETEPALLTHTIGADLERTVAARPDAEALVEVATGRRWTWAELDQDVDALARGLMALGLQAGDRVGIWAPNCAEWTLTQYATAKAGIVLVNVNPSYRTHELTYVVNQSGLRVLISASRFKTSDYRAMVAQARDDCPGLERVVHLDTEDWADLLAGGEQIEPEALRVRSAELDPWDPINIQYTSGTTGRPKGATLSHRNILNNGFLVTELIGLGEADRLCIPVPFYHCFGMVMANLGCTSHGATMVIPAPGFDPGLTLAAVAQERCTVLYGVPAMFIAMQHHPDFASFDLTSLRSGIMAGSICPVEVMRRCLDDMHMSGVSIAYGMTETSRSPPRPARTTTWTGVRRRSGGCIRTWRSRSSTPSAVRPSSGARPESCAPGGTRSCWATGRTRSRRRMRSTRTAGCTPVTWPRCARTATAPSWGGSRTWSSGAGRTSTRARSRSSSTPTPTSRTSRSSASPTSTTARSCAHGCGCAWARTRWTPRPSRDFCRGRLAHVKIPRYVLVVDDFPMTVTGKVRKVEMRAGVARPPGPEGQRVMTTGIRVTVPVAPRHRTAPASKGRIRRRVGHPQPVGRALPGPQPQRGRGDHDPMMGEAADRGGEVETSVRGVRDRPGRAAHRPREQDGGRVELAAVAGHPVPGEPGPVGAGGRG